MAPETPPSRGISSRLLTMKFMQRAATSGPAPESPPDEPSSKRRKFQNSPLSGDFHSFDQAAVQAALKQQEAKRLSALEASRAELADTHWVLDGDWGKSAETEDAPPNIVYVGYADIDGDDGEDESKLVTHIGRKKVGGSKKKDTKAETESTPNIENDSSDSSGPGDSEDSSDEDDESDAESSSGDEESTPKPAKPVKGLSSGGQGRTRVNLQPKKSTESMKAREFREKRKKKEVKLNQLASISGGASSISGAGKPNAPFNCHNCGKPGHKAADCPGQRRGDGKRKSFGKSR
ncbi:zinc knuckle [Colletotrichum tofieldiae]|uniref:Zinc knuckle n=1 Tax=Colletotrichum tofieldiae TaxID=708197 RepID=A0A166SJJ7_9PEZI|nr:zinc knuckle [Colletotrichum tofieldiae]